MFPMWFPFQRQQNFLMGLPFHPLLIQGATILVIALAFFLAVRFLLDKVPMPSDENDGLAVRAEPESPFDSSTHK